MKVDDSEEQDLRQLNHHLLGDNKIVKDGVVAEEQHVAKENGFRTGGTTDDMKDGSSGVVQAQSALQIQQQPPQTAIVCWERFLHIRSLKVLLVENDDSTRHVVAALLRNCSYEVVEAANGIQAWRILEDLTYHIDLVLTEVVMPCLSGVGLLCKIMSHKTRKNVPVIMMSSHDSMGLVFKCLSKGAVDFLVKPIRKNELKNLWQHVWRRCHSSSGSGSESGTQTQKSVKSKSIEKSDNNTGSNDEDDNGSTGLNVGDGSDTGSGTQSSWTKQAADVDSPCLEPSWDAHCVLECADSTCAQVIHSNVETSQNKQILLPTIRGCQEPGEPQDLEAGMRRNPDPQPEHPTHVLKIGSANQSHTVEKYSNKLNEEMETSNFDLNIESPSNKPKNGPPNLTGVVMNNTEPLIESTEFEGRNRNSNVSDFNNKSGSNTEKLPSLELSLKRLRGVKDVGTAVQDDNRNVLRRSDSSAFSRYNTGSNSYKNLASNAASASPNDIKLNDKEKEVAQEIQCHSHGDPLNQCSNGGSNNIDMGSTTNAAVAKPVALKNKPAVTSPAKCLHPSSFHPLKNELFYAAPHITREKSDGKTPKATLTRAAGAKQELQMQHHNNHYDHCVHLEMQALDHDDVSLKKMAAPAPHCGSSNVIGGPTEGNAANYSVNGSASGSNHGSNGQNGSSTAVNAGGINMESDNRNVGKTGSGNDSGSGSGNGSGNRDQDKFAQREAALNKFRQKRKERCFRKKVRYQSRKRLAEQRPCLRGQFVRQTANDSSSNPTND